ncbi:unnamed protein product [Schistosoma curassoni]|uniref:Lipoprotein n=1 Tax=Schistosoma curassoni TaxID=6186 RepID=A0A183JHQ9_9TREM|nr:unnamed protein product [Schistosoma curassoni]
MSIIGCRREEDLDDVTPMQQAAPPYNPSPPSGFGSDFVTDPTSISGGVGSRFPYPTPVTVAQQQPISGRVY